MHSSIGNGGPVLDEATFQKLLAAAYVLQEHNDRLRPPDPAEAHTQAGALDSDSTTTLSAIVETQHQIQTGHLDVDGAAVLVVERLRKITGAQGAAIGIIDQDKLVYRAGIGMLAGLVGTSQRPEATLSAATLLHDAVLRCSDASTDFRVNPEIVQRMGLRSLIAVPVFHDGKTAGTLELVFAQPNAFHEHDVRTCQLMAGLVTEALAHAAEETWRKDVAAERASMLQVLEKIKPQLARLANDAKLGMPLSGSDSTDDTGTREDSLCTHCGNEIAPAEVFCGSCGTSRATTARNDLQSKWATLWNLKKASGQILASAAADAVPTDPDANLRAWSVAPNPAAPEAPALSLEASAEPLSKIPEPPAASGKNEIESVVPHVPGQDLAPPPEVPPSLVVTPPRESAESRVWLRSIAVSPPAVQLKGFWQKNKGFLRKHPGDLALAASVVLFLITIVWAISSDSPTTSADSANAQPAATATQKPKRRQAPPPPKLTMFERFLVSVGLAEPPPAPSYSGNPSIPVWVDVHTALYYCPGDDLYGKTAQGKIASQRDAQIDQFEPASRKVCD